MLVIESLFKLPDMLRKLLILCLGSILWTCTTQETAEEPKPVSQELATNNDLDSLTGLVKDEHFAIVRAQCTACHSAKLITQNRATREGWQQMIRWMQAEQGLWDLGTSESNILDYLSKHYGPQNKGRRAPLTNIEWYQLEQ